MTGLGGVAYRRATMTGTGGARGFDGAAPSWAGVDLRRVVFSATQARGQLGPVGALEAKLHAIVRRPDIRTVVVAAAYRRDPVLARDYEPIDQWGGQRVFRLTRAPQDLPARELFVVTAATLPEARELLGVLETNAGLPPRPPERVPDYTGRRALLTTITDFLLAPNVPGEQGVRGGPNYLVLQGEMGWGKSTLR